MRSTKRGKIKTVPNNTTQNEKKNNIQLLLSFSGLLCIYVYVCIENTSVVSNVEEGIKHSTATLKIFCVVSRSLLSRKFFNSSQKKV